MSLLDVAAMDGEPLGFVSFASIIHTADSVPDEATFVLSRNTALNYIFVTGEARRRGLGTTLFRHAVKGDYTPTFMTRAGRALEEHALRLIAAEGHDGRTEDRT